MSDALDVLQAAADRSLRYLHGIRDRRVAPLPEQLDRLKALAGPLPAALAANWLGGAWDQNAGLVASSPVGAALEEIAQQWLVDVLSLPAGTGFREFTEPKTTRCGQTWGFAITRPAMSVCCSWVDTRIRFQSDETVLDERRLRHIECALLCARLTDRCE